MKKQLKKQRALVCLSSLLAVILIFATGCGERASAPSEDTEIAEETELTGAFAGASAMPEEVEELVVMEEPERETEVETEEPESEEAEETEETETETETEETVEKTPAEVGAQTTIIGDSITWMTEDMLKAAFPGVDIYCQGGKVFDYRVPENPGGLEVIGTLAANGTLRDTIVFALGTNNRDSVQTPALNESMFEVLHQIAGDRTLFLVTNYDLRHPETYDRNNAAIRAAAGKYGWNVIDWAGIVEGTGNPEKYILDEGAAAVGDMQVHPTDPDGKNLWVSSIKDALMENAGKE